MEPISQLGKATVTVQITVYAEFNTAMHRYGHVYGAICQAIGALRTASLYKP